MKVTKATSKDSDKQFWITARADDDGEILIVHIISNNPMEWNLGGNTLNVKPKKEG